MADFCKQCSIYMSGEDDKDLAGCSTEQDTRNGLYCMVMCEGCGYIQVDHTGQCISPDCLKKHGASGGENK